MLKRIFVTLVFVLCTIISFAQIQKNFFDFTLGVTNYNEVCKYLDNHKIYYKKTTHYIDAKNMTFGEHKWPSVTFYFYNDKLYEIHFSHTILAKEGSDELNELNELYSKYNLSLHYKYKNYYFPYSPSRLATIDDIFSALPIGSDDWCSSYSDKKTEVYLYRNKMATTTVGLIYFDRQLRDKSINQQKDKYYRENTVKDL